MKTYIYGLIGVFAIAAFSLTGCESFREAGKADKMEPLKVKITAKSLVDEVPSVAGLEVSLYCADEEFRIDLVMESEDIIVEGVIPGRYMLSVGGIVKGTDNNTYKLNDTKTGVAIVTDSEFHFDLKGMMFSPLIFKEIYYSGSKKGTANYFPDQFHEIYNNSDEVLYLDGLFIGDLHPTGTTATPPTWITYVKDNVNTGVRINEEENVFGRTVFRIPGNGTDYPLEPGESCVLALSAVNHQLEMYNPESHVNLYDAEFEFWLGHANGDQPSPNIPLYHYYTTPTKQFLAAVGGPAMAIYRVPDGIDWDPTSEQWGATAVASNGGTSGPFARIPIEWTLDVVECGTDETKLTQKRVPGVLDSGMAYVGANYVGKSIARHMSDMTNINGDPTYVDTNNSSFDFLIDPDQPELGMARDPVVRRNGARMPAWNFTLQLGGDTE